MYFKFGPVKYSEGSIIFSEIDKTYAGIDYYISYTAAKLEFGTTK